MHSTGCPILVAFFATEWGFDSTSVPHTPATSPSPPSHRPSFRPRPCAPAPCPLPEYPTPAADSPRISCAAPASGSATSPARRRPKPLHSMQPIPADRQPSFTLAIVSLSLKILCKSPTGHTSGFPGSDRRTRAGSVTIVFSFWRTTGSGSVSITVFPYDFDILRPSVPGNFAAGVSRDCGSGKTERPGLVIGSPPGELTWKEPLVAP